jgi:predicted ATPase
MGYYTVQEVARYVIDEQLEQKGGVLPWVNKEAFEQRVLATQLDWEKSIPQGIDAILDRGLPDIVAYYKEDGSNVPEQYLKPAREANYRKVFLLEPLPVYKNDNSRREDPEKAKRLHELIINTYKELNYELISIPAIGAEERKNLILKYMKE